MSLGRSEQRRGDSSRGVCVCERVEPVGAAEWERDVRPESGGGCASISPGETELPPSKWAQRAPGTPTETVRANTLRA